MSLVDPAIHGDVHFEHDVYAVRFRYKFSTTIPASIEFYCIDDSTIDGLWTLVGK
jgi:hypothetical protein